MVKKANLLHIKIDDPQRIKNDLLDSNEDFQEYLDELNDYKKLTKEKNREVREIKKLNNSIIEEIKELKTMMKAEMFDENSESQPSSSRITKTKRTKK